VKQFFAAEAALRSVLLLFNLLAEFQRAAGLPSCREPATLRTQVLTCGAILGRAGRRAVVHLSQSWGGLGSRIPLLDNILACAFPISPKLTPVLGTSEPDPACISELAILPSRERRSVALLRNSGLAIGDVAYRIDRKDLRL
jgi:hypothetical protein